MSADAPAVFLTYGWCRVAYVILQSLASHGVVVHVGDPSRLAMCRSSRSAASFRRYESPYVDPARFVRDICAAMTELGATFLMPGHEEGILLARHRDAFRAGTILPVGDADLMERVADKGELVGIARAAGVDVPRTLEPRNREELQEIAATLAYPAIVKPRIGNSAKGVTIVSSANDCVRAALELVRTANLGDGRWPLVQELVAGEPYGVCVLYRKGQVRATFGERYLRCKDGMLGTSVFRESVKEPAVEARALALMDHLGWHGVAHMDFLYDRASGRVCLLEVNPRFWGALDLAVRAGVDFPWLLYRMEVDGDVAQPAPFKVGIRSRWIVGEAVGLANQLRRGRLGQALRTTWSILREHADGFDDFRALDPVPLFTELLYYGTRFVATANTNPVVPGMIR